MEFGLADRIQSQTRFTGALSPLTPPAQLSPLHSRQRSTEASPTGCFCCSSTLFRKRLRFNLFACLLFTAYSRLGFFFLLTPRETELRSKPFYSLQKRTSSVFYGYRAPDKSQLTQLSSLLITLILLTPPFTSIFNFIFPSFNSLILPPTLCPQLHSSSFPLNRRQN